MSNEENLIALAEAMEKCQANVVFNQKSSWMARLKCFFVNILGTLHLISKNSMRDETHDSISSESQQSSPQFNTNLFDLPQEVLRMILAKTNGQTIARMESVLPMARSFAHDNLLWKNLYQKDFGIKERLVMNVGDDGIPRPRFIPIDEEIPIHKLKANVWKKSYKLLHNSVTLVQKEEDRNKYRHATVVIEDRNDNTNLYDRVVLFRGDHLGVDQAFFERHYPKDKKGNNKSGHLIWLGYDEKSKVCYVRTSSLEMYGKYVVLRNSLVANLILNWADWTMHPVDETRKSFIFYNCNFCNINAVTFRNHTVVMENCDLPHHIKVVGLAPFLIQKSFMNLRKSSLLLTSQYKANSETFTIRDSTFVGVHILSLLGKKFQVTKCFFIGCSFDIRYEYYIAPANISGLLFTENAFENTPISARANTLLFRRNLQGLLDQWIHELPNSNNIQ